MLNYYLHPRRGGNAREDGMTKTFIIYAEWTPFISMLLSILLPYKKMKETSESNGVNSVISFLTPVDKVKRKRQSQYTEPSPTKPLSDIEKRNNVVDAHNNLIDSVSLYCQPGLGYIHVLTKWFQYCGKLEMLPTNALTETKALCRSQCYVCNGQYNKHLH